jgi:tetratricopeptide (TPR) repeat protein
MTERILWTLSSLALLTSALAAAGNPWGHLKKIQFYEASNNQAEVRSNLERLDAEALPPEEKVELIKKLAELGDGFYQKKNLAMAEAVYRKALRISPEDAWPIYNKLERIARRQGRIVWNFRNVWRQFKLVAQGFGSSLLLLDSGFSVLMFSGLLLFFMVTASLVIRFFKLAAHDFILGGGSRFRIQRLLLLLVLLLWPLAITGGWGFYPFLFCGLLWNYLSHDERASIKRIQVVLLALAFLFCLGRYLGKSMQSPGFQTIQNVYSGHLFPESTWSRFDNEMKVMQAYAYYHQGQADAAMDVLLATGGNYTTTLKSNLLGNLYYEKGNFLQSIQFYRQSLSQDDRNPLTLKNFTVALLKNNDPELFRFYSKNYPRINEFKDKVSGLQKNKLPKKILWQRLANYSWRSFHVWNFLKITLIEFIKFPVLLGFLILAAYVIILNRLFPALGQSVFCSKCAKIIKKMPIEQVRSHVLCEDCYQLFLLKDPIFLEAKMIKEREINRQRRLKNALLLFASLAIPGFILNFKDKGRAFMFLFMSFCTVFGLFLFTAMNFKSLFGAIPMFLNLIGLAGLVLYLAINTYSLKGEHNGL